MDPSIIAAIETPPVRKLFQPTAGERYTRDLRGAFQRSAQARHPHLSVQLFKLIHQDNQGCTSGASTFTMSYRYSEINGRKVGGNP